MKGARLQLRRRPPPRLRTKTGCLTCRKRKKKCDEKKPECQTCSRLSLACIWDDNPHEESCSGEQSAVACTRPTAKELLYLAATYAAQPAKALRVTPGLRSENEQKLFNYMAEEFMPMLVRESTSPIFTDQSHVLTIALQDPCVMDTLLANACIFLSCEYENYNNNSDAALKFYAKAVRELRKSLQDRQVTAADDSLMVSTTFLGLYEESRNDTYYRPLLHYGTTAQLLKLHAPGLAKQSTSKTRQIFLRCTAESTLYHIATRAIFEPEIERLANTFTWNDLEPFLKFRPAADESDCANSPLLGSFPRTYYLVFETTRLSRRVPLGAQDMSWAQKIYEEATSIKAQIEQSMTQASTPDGVTGCGAQKQRAPEADDHFSLFWILAVEIFLLKIIDPSTTVSSPLIQKRVEQGCGLLQSPSFSLFVEGEIQVDSLWEYYDILCWPLMAFGCSAIRKEHIAILKTVIVNLADDKYCCTYEMLVRQIMEAAWEVNERTHFVPLSSSSEPFEPPVLRCQDGLDILVQNHDFINNTSNRETPFIMEPSSTDLNCAGSAMGRGRVICVD